MRDKPRVEDIIEWIIQNHEDTEAIDKINSVTFPFTSKYKNFSKRDKYVEETND